MLKKAFKDINKDNTGIITADQLEEFEKVLGTETKWKNELK